MSTAIPGEHEVTIRSIAASDTYDLRHTILWPNKPMEYVMLDEDAQGQHFGAFIQTSRKSTNSNNDSDNCTNTNNTSSKSSANNNSNDEHREQDVLIGIISLYIFPSHSSRFRKFATHASYQGQGIGSKLLAHVIQFAEAQGAKSIWCDARRSAAGFYERFGMVVDEGEGVFDKGGIEYVRMRREFS